MTGVRVTFLWATGGARKDLELCGLGLSDKLLKSLVAHLTTYQVLQARGKGNAFATCLGLKVTLHKCKRMSFQAHLKALQDSARGVVRHSTRHGALALGLGFTSFGLFVAGAAQQSLQRAGHSGSGVQLQKEKSKAEWAEGRVEETSDLWNGHRGLDWLQGRFGDHSSQSPKACVTQRSVLHWGYPGTALSLSHSRLTGSRERQVQ